MQKDKGYTLIELLVGITVISIVFAIGYASFREFSRRQALGGVVKSTLSDLRLAQQLSLTGEKPSSGTCAVLSGYTFSSSTNGYTLTANCSDGNIVVKTEELNAEVGISNTTVKFKVLGQGTNLDADTTITLTHQVTGSIATISVGKNGDIH